MIAQIQHFLVSQQIFTLFICLAIGYVLGNIRLFGSSFTLGSTVGTLAVALIIGQTGSFPRDKMLGTIFFWCFYVFNRLPDWTIISGQHEAIRWPNDCR